MSERLSRPEGVRDEVWEKVIELRKVLAGKTTDEVPDTKGKSEFDGTILDGNVANEAECQVVMEWLVNLIGSEIMSLPVKSTIHSPDRATEVIVYDRALGENGLYLGRVKNQGEEPSWVLWPDWQYDGLFGGIEE